jgi:hypothetical protein
MTVVRAGDGSIQACIDSSAAPSSFKYYVRSNLGQKSDHLTSNFCTSYDSGQQTYKGCRDVSLAPDACSPYTGV